MSVGEVGPVELQAKLLPAACEHERQFISEQWTVVMGESDSAVELRIARHALLDTGHADQNEADVVTVEELTQVFQAGRVEPLCLIGDHQLHVFPGHGACRCASVLIDADVDAAE